MKKIKDQLNTPLQILARCPATGEQVIINEQEHLYIPDEQVTWWRCLACRGWHILIDKAIEVSK